jgi:hypothetical protein
MENKKYFVPEIWDFYVGYEYEFKNFQTNVWEKFKFLIGDEFSSLYDFEEDINRCRVPYLTKEQLEEEGWEQINPKTLTHGYFLRGECRLELWEDNIICIRNGYWYPENTIYKGQCKDINTFRKIIKLLGI